MTYHLAGDSTVAPMQSSESPMSGWGHALDAFVEVRERDGTAVLCTSAERRLFDGEQVVPSHGDYPNAVRDLARELDAPLIDLTVFTSWLYEDLGGEASAALFSHFAPGEAAAWPDGLTDNTHFRFDGARRIAAFVARSLRAIERRDGDLPARGAPDLA